LDDSDKAAGQTGNARDGICNFLPFIDWLAFKRGFESSGIDRVAFGPPSGQAFRQ
jgi:hypothetical protein